ncbi:MAG TPA: glycosyl hydrolase, partial [Chloroflexota bacterium]|nr:glycosyl hydrolase [Chloroflexota bacterium]
MVIVPASLLLAIATWLAVLPTPVPSPVAEPGSGPAANRILNRDFPDPDVLQVGEVYYAYATNAGGANI